MRRAAPLLCALSAVLLFLPVFGFRFLSWDDQLLLLDNPFARGFSTVDLRWSWTSFHAGHYMPLTWMSYALDHALGGLHPLPYHLTNLLLHGVNAGLLCLLLMKVLSMSFPGAPDRSLAWAALAGAAWWACHGWRVEAVAWVSQRKELLSTAFLFPSVLCYLHSKTTPTARRRAWSAGAFILFVLAVLSKAVAGVLPAVLMVLDRSLLGRRDTWRRLAAEKAPYWPLSAAAFAAAGAAQTAAGATFSWEALPWTNRLAQAVHGAGYMTLGTLLNLRPALIYELKTFDPFAAPTVWMGLFLALAAFGCLRAGARGRAALAAGTVFLLVLSPTLGFFQSGVQHLAPRYTYLASASFAALLAAGVAAFRGRRWVAPAACLLVGWGVLQTLDRLPAWRDSVRFWTEAARESPASAFAAKNLAYALEAAGRRPEALDQFERSVHLSGGDAPAHRAGFLCEWGAALWRAGKPAEAESALRRAADLSPARPDVLCVLADLLAKTGRPAEAREAWARAVRLDPSLPPLPPGAK